MLDFFLLLIIELKSLFSNIFVMKKYILLLFALLFVLWSCNKTDIDVELEKQRNEESFMTDDEFNEMKKEDPEFLDDYMNEMIDADKEQNLREKSELVDEMIESEDLKKSWKWWKFSCNMIAEWSTCIEYYGSIWTIEQVKLWCPDGIVSYDACPADTVWGCNTWEGTMADMVSWLYLRWNWWMTSDSIKHAKNACDATMMASWIAR